MEKQTDFDHIAEGYLDEGYLNKDGFVITPVDDELLDIEDLKEVLQAGPFTLGDVVIAYTPTQHPGEPLKPRPMLVVVDNGVAEVIGFQITSQAPGNGFRSKFKVGISDLGSIRAIKQSYINYDHFVKVPRTQIDTRIKRSLSDTDLKALYSAIEKNITGLLINGFAASSDAEMLNDMMRNLRTWYPDLNTSQSE